MNNAKLKKFNERMGRQKFSKGGYIKHLGNRAYFDNGGVTTMGGPTDLSGPSAVGNNSPTMTGTKLGSVNIGGDPNSIQNQANPINYLGNGLNSLIDSTQNHFTATGAPITNGTNVAQLNSAYNTAQGGINAQQGLVGQLQGQNGINNQNQVYNQTQGIANGTGPNPALAQLNQQTNTNVNNQAALMAGQRGSSANTGLLARQAAQQGAATQQQAVGQAASNQAQQQLSAIGSAGNIAQNQVNNLGQGITGLNTAAQNEQNTLQNANTANNNANVSMQSNLNNVNGQISQGNQSAMNGLTGGLMSGVSSIASLFADGGEVGSNFGNAGYSAITQPPAISTGSMGQSPDMGSALKSGLSGPGGGSSGGGSGGGAGGIMGMAAMLARGGGVCPGPHQSHVANYLASGGAAKAVPAMVSPGEIYLKPDEVEQVKHGANPLKLGTKIPGKPKVKGDSLKNDTVPATLEEGGVVIPRHIMNTKSSDKAALFVLKSLKATGKHQPAHMRKPS